MKTLLSKPFETQLNTWLEKLVERVTVSSVSQETWALDALQNLRLKRDALLSQLGRDDTIQIESYHRSMTQTARELMEAVLVEEGPTSFAWLNLPLAKVDSFLKGRPMDSGLAPLLREAFKRVYDGGDCPALEGALKELMLWAEGHKQLSGLDIVARVEAIVAAAEAGASEQKSEQRLPALLQLCHSTEDEEQEFYFQAFLDGLEDWEKELSELEAILEAVEGADLSVLSLVCEAFDELSTALSEEAPWSELEACLDTLTTAWEVAAPEVQYWVRRAAEEEPESYEHLESLQRVVTDFQTGLTGLERLQREVAEHTSRWNEVAQELSRSLAGIPGASLRLDSVGLSLRALATVTSPGDARLSAVTQAYVESLKSLMKTA